MLHNKHYEILRQFLGDYLQEIYGRALIGKVPMSHKGIALALRELEQQNILQSRKQGSLRYYRLNISHSEIRDILLIVEALSKVHFLAKHRKLAHLFHQDDRVVGIFGSYAEGTQRKESDIDVFVIGKKRPEDYDVQGKRLDLDISVRYFSKKRWRGLLHTHNNLCREMLRNHVLLFGMEQFIAMAWRGYYGFH